MRRAVDFVVAIAALILLAPAFLIIAVLIRLDSEGPILYTPRMIGQAGTPFWLLRFRTMAGQQVTGVGKFLRNYSLDHLPMLINLLRGDLTLPDQLSEFRRLKPNVSRCFLQIKTVRLHRGGGPLFVIFLRHIVGYFV